MFHAWRVHEDKSSAIVRVKRLEEKSRAPSEQSISGKPEQASVRLGSRPFRKVANNAPLIPNHSANLPRNRPYVCRVGNDGNFGSAFESVFDQPTSRISRIERHVLLRL